MKKTSKFSQIIAGSQMRKVVQHPCSFARVVRSLAKVDSLTKTKLYVFEGVSRTDIWKVFEGIGFSLNRLLLLLIKRLAILILLVALDTCFRTLRKIDR